MTRTNGSVYCDECDVLMSGNDDYMVHDHVWLEGAKLEEHLHARCLQKRLGRLLTPADFDLTLPVNCMVRFGYALKPIAKAFLSVKGPRN